MSSQSKSTEAEFRPIPGGEVRLPAQLVFEVVGREEERTEAQPGRLVRLKVAARKLARPVPPGFAAEEGAVERLLQERVVAVVAGFFLGPGGTISTPDGTEPSGFFSGGLIGRTPGGRSLSPDAFYLALVEALERKTFTIGEVEIFCRDAQVLRVLRQGVLDHVNVWLGSLGGPAETVALAAIAKAKLVPGFTGGREALFQYLAIPVGKAAVAELLAIVKRIKGVAS